MNQFIPTQAMVDSATSLIQAMAYERTVRPIVEEYQKAILAEGRWHVDPSKDDERKEEVILDPKHSFLLTDEDFAVYLRRCKAARDKAGLRVDHDDECPLLVAQNMVRICEKEIIDCMSEVTTITNEKSLLLPNEDRRSLIDLTLHLLAPFVRAKQQNRGAAAR